MTEQADAEYHEVLAAEYTRLAKAHQEIAQHLRSAPSGTPMPTPLRAFTPVSLPPTAAPTVAPSASRTPASMPGPPAVLHTRATPYSMLGVALEPINASSPGPLTTNIVHVGRGWLVGGPHAWELPSPPNIEYDARGWPRAIPEGVVLRALFAWQDTGGGPAPEWGSGRYDVTWAGAGHFTIEPHPEGTRASVKVELAGAGRAVFTYTAQGSDPPCGFMLVLRSTDITNPLRDLTITPSGAKHGTWSPAVVEALQPFGHVHFGYATRTNPRALTPPRARTWQLEGASPFWSGGEGVPYAACVELANEARARPWFCIPDATDAHFVAGLGRFLRRSVTADRIYIEVGMNPWRGRVGLPLQPDITQYVQRALTAARTLHTELGDRLRLVLTGRLDTPDYARLILSRLQGVPTAQQLLPSIVLGVPVHVGRQMTRAEHWATLGAMDVATFLRQVTSLIDGPVQSQIAEHVAIARGSGMELVCTEGGPSLAPPPGAPVEVQALLRAAARDRLIGDVVIRLLEVWRHAGGGVFTHYALSESLAPGYQDHRRYAALTAWASLHRDR